MPMNFHNEQNKQSYTTRIADASWIELMNTLIEMKQVDHAADIGCGGGIYTKTLADLGIRSVTGIDFSEVMIESARMNCRNYNQVKFHVGSDSETGFPNNAVNLILERALIHHLTDLKPCFKEAFRILKTGGNLIIQDRTPSDCLLEGTNNHIRGYLFSVFPKLAAIETERRHNSKVVVQNLEDAGFKDIKSVNLWETRQLYPAKEELLKDIRSRTGRSILHELNDYELDLFINFLDEKLTDGGIIEKDRWTVWKAVKK
ncbi:class I SAM-dependent methyltransferase [Virgibacillus flavescens]|uniref:class I SAM-dependent methyltransferase n=1 Tax=Virgibacillus flavescens TaxID=1611422 RepID=UPI003D3420FA